MNTGGFERERRDMVERQLAGQGIRDPRVLEAMERIPRHAFMPEEAWELAYAPRAVDIGAGQTISQPYMVATMTEALELDGSETVLEIGTGSGYQAAILGWLSHTVVTVERIESLARRARGPLRAIGAGNVHVVVGDGSAPHFVQAGFERILVTAAAPRVPKGLLELLADPGRLVCPVGDDALQVLHVVDRQGGQDHLRTTTACRFVPLVGEEGLRRR